MQQVSKNKYGTYTVDLRKFGVERFNKPTRREAIVARDELIHLYQGGMDMTNRDGLVGRMLDDWYAWKKRQSQIGEIGEDHFAGINAKLDIIKGIELDGKSFVDWKIADINTGQLLHKVQPALKENVSVSTANGRWNIITESFQYAVLHKLVAANPCTGIKPYKRGRNPHKRMKPSDVNAAIEAMPKYQLQALVSSRTGMRTGELRALQWEQIAIGNMSSIRVTQSVDKKRRFIKVKTDSGQNREIHLPNEVALKLQKWRSEQPREQCENNLVFPHESGEIEKADIWRVQGMHKGCQAAGVEKFSFHYLRHFYASVLIFNSDLPAATIMHYMGHADLGFTMRQYGHWLEQRGLNHEQNEKIENAFASLA